VASEARDEDKYTLEYFTSGERGEGEPPFKYRTFYLDDALAEAWRIAGSGLTASTSALLSLKPGNWYYRVRGVDTLLAGTKTGLSWSEPVRLVVTKPRFKIVH